MATTGAKISQIRSKRYSFYAYNDYLMATADLVFINPVSGTGAGFSVASPGGTAISAIQASSGTTNTGRCSAVCQSMTLLTGGVGKLYYGAGLRVSQLSTATETFTLRVGFIDSSSAESTDGIFFRYTDGVNSGRWECVTRSNNVETAINSGVLAQSSTFIALEVFVNAPGTSATFYIAGTLVGTITTNIPTTTARIFSFGIVGIKSVGITSIVMYALDYQEIYQEFTTPR